MVVAGVVAVVVALVVAGSALVHSHLAARIDDVVDPADAAAEC